MFDLETSIYCLKKRIIYLFFLRRKECSFVTCGSGYGGFDVADFIQNVERPIVYSFGIGEDLSFSEAMIEKFGAEVYAFDPTPKSIEYVKKSVLFNNPKFHFFPWGISNKDEQVEFYLPVDDQYVSGSVVMHNNVRADSIIVEMRSLKSIVEELKHNKINVLKMDVEGSEFKVISELHNKEFEMIDQICMEIHERFFQQPIMQLWKLLKELRNRKFVLANVDKGLDVVTFLKK